MNECNISKTELRRGTVARSSSADVALNARFAGVGHAETRGGKDEKRTEKEKGKRRKGKRRKREERREENRSTALGRDVGHLTTRTPPRTAEQRQRKGKETKDWRKTSREEGQAVVTEDATTLLQRSAVLIGNGPLQMLQRLRCNQDYQQW